MGGTSLHISAFVAGMRGAAQPIAPLGEPCGSKFRKVPGRFF